MDLFCVSLADEDGFEARLSLSEPGMVNLRAVMVEGLVNYIKHRQMSGQTEDVKRYERNNGSRANSRKALRCNFQDMYRANHKPETLEETRGINNVRDVELVGEPR